MQGRCTSSTWEKGSDAIASEDLGGHYWGLLACGEVKNLGLQVTPEGDIFETRGNTGMALDGGACREGSAATGTSMGGYQVAWTHANILTIEPFPLYYNDSLSSHDE